MQVGSTQLATGKRGLTVLRLHGEDIPPHNTFTTTTTTMDSADDAMLRAAAERTAKRAEKKARATEAFAAAISPAGLAQKEAAKLARKASRAAARAAESEEGGDGGGGGGGDETSGGAAVPTGKRKREGDSGGTSGGNVDSSQALKKLKKSSKTGAAAVSTKEETENPLVAGFPGISAESAAALAARGILTLFPIQYKTLGPLLAGKDMLARARTGSGKTLAFALPIIERLRANALVGFKGGRPPRALILAPTRELARQVSDDFLSLAGKGSNVLAILCCYGGVPLDPQRSALRIGIDVLVGTPGRVIDLLDGGVLKLSAIRTIVLDEADRMLDMGFAEDVAKILGSVPGLAGFGAAGAGAAISSSGGASGSSEAKPQVMLFSATVPAFVRDIARRHMTTPLDINLVEGEAASTDVAHLVCACPWQVRPATIGDLIRVYCGAGGRCIVFVDTKKEADELAVDAALTARIEAKAMHGDVPQSSREACLAAFKKGAIRCLVATDVAARGLDIKGVELVIQTQPPCGRMSGKADIDTYVHRAGRTGRAGAKGTCVTLFTRTQEHLIAALEKATKNVFTRIGAPQPEDLARAEGDGAATRLASVHSDQVLFFRTAAVAAIDAGRANGESASDVLARAFALLAGAPQPPVPRSLLSASEGWLTFAWRAPTPPAVLGVAWSALRRELDAAVVEDVRGMTLLSDGSGVVFDVPAARIKSVIEAAAKQGSQLSRPTKLPGLVASERAIPEHRPPAWAENKGGGRGGFGGRGGGRGGFGERGAGGSFRGVASSSFGGFGRGGGTGGFRGGARGGAHAGFGA